MFRLLLICLIVTGTVHLSDVSYYEILGVTKQASTQEIRQAYKKLAIKFHPDKNTDSGEQEKFIQITEAYETLKDPEKRKNYDLYGSYPSYTRKYDYRSQAEYNNLFYNGLYHEDPFVDTLSGRSYYNYLNEGFHFINFYSPFCPPCQNLVDHWKKLAETYKGIIKVGAVNCKYHNSFCYNTMRIGSYPSLLFYPNGKHGNYIYYRGDRTFEALDQFVMAYLNSRVHVPIVSQIKSKDKPIAYVLGNNRIERSALTRIAYHLNGLVNVVIVEDDSLRAKLTENDYVTVFFKYKDISKSIENSEEKEVLKEIVEALPKINLINPEKFKDIRNQLRSGSKTPWVLYFSTKGHDRLLLHQIRISFPEFNFGEIDCDKWGELCASLHVEEPPAWGLMKAGGAYQRAPAADLRAYLPAAAAATNLQTLSASDLMRIVQGDVVMWVLVVVPYQVAWDHISEPFTQTSLRFVDNEDISFGIMTCTLSTDKYCRQLAQNEPSVFVQQGRERHYYSGQIDEHHLTEFIQLLIDSKAGSRTNNTDMELNEQRVLEILDASSRRHSWLVAHLPARCGRPCDHLAHEWRLVAKKLRPLEFVRVGMLRCGQTAGEGGFCANVRAPTARLYPLASGQHYTVSLQNLSQAPYILEWALGLLDDSVHKLNWNTFSKNVVAEELNPSSDKKPWLVYFHSPRCYRCYEMYADFAIAGIFLHNVVQMGKVNCISERGLCQHEHITSYPSLKLYLNRNQHQRFSSVITLQLKDYANLIEDIKPHLIKYDESLLNRIDNLGFKSSGIHINHDEF